LGACVCEGLLRCTTTCSRLLERRLVKTLTAGTRGDVAPPGRTIEGEGRARRQPARPLSKKHRAQRPTPAHATARRRQRQGWVRYPLLSPLPTAGAAAALHPTGLHFGAAAAAAAAGYGSHPSAHPQRHGRPCGGARGHRRCTPQGRTAPTRARPPTARRAAARTRHPLGGATAGLGGVGTGGMQRVPSPSIGMRQHHHGATMMVANHTCCVRVVTHHRGAVQRCAPSREARRWAPRCALPPVCRIAAAVVVSLPPRLLPCKEYTPRILCGFPRWVPRVGPPCRPDGPPRRHARAVGAHRGGRPPPGRRRR